MAFIIKFECKMGGEKKISSQKTMNSVLVDNSQRMWLNRQHFCLNDHTAYSACCERNHSFQIMITNVCMNLVSF